MITPGATMTGRRVESVLNDAAIYVGALIDGICSRSGKWVDWERYRPLFIFRPGPDEGPVSGVSLALARNERGLRAGGFIEMHVLPKQRRVEANGGYYDEYNQPRPVIEGSLSWQELTYQGLGQTLLLMYDRIVKAYGERSGDVDEAGDADSRRADRAGVSGRDHGSRQRGGGGGGEVGGDGGPGDGAAGAGAFLQEEGLLPSLGHRRCRASSQQGRLPGVR